MSSSSKSGTSSSSSSSVMPQPILKEVTNGEGPDMLKDDRSGVFETPHWKDDREAQYPYLHRGGGHMTVAEVKWLLPNCEPQGPSYAFGEGSDVNGLEEVQASSEITEEGTVVTATNLYSSKSSLLNETKYFDDLEIQWKLRHGTGEPMAAGTSVNPVHVCLEEGELPDNEHFHVAVHAVVEYEFEDGKKVLCNPSYDKKYGGQLEGETDEQRPTLWQDAVLQGLSSFYYYPPYQPWRAISTPISNSTLWVQFSV